ncbi:MAG: chitobiase/beta-hexosaminidase C-terminal domain-containing protein [Butyrivibrio sp.]|nr:chitobiase/beta-hexosaminidase C-terminal domain-containing protein [Butyrivibrio sp.]MBR1643617.1 chitobiase/beta-hexosaminidase C-terminal domain-containing protein [Butyrivibrio sp.]
MRQKRFLSWIMVFTLLVGMFSFPAYAEGNTATTTISGDGTAEKTGTMTITLTIKEMIVAAENVSVAYDGQPHGITVNVADPASDYTVKFGTTEGTYDLDASPTQTEKGSQTIYYQVTANNYVTKTGSATVTISEASAVAATVATPTFSPDAGTYTEAQSVTISCETTGATIYYTTDGSNPSASSTAYSGAITVGETTTIKAIAVKEGMTDSSVASTTYTISEGPEPSEETKVEVEDLSDDSISDDLKNSGFNTVSKIEDALETTLSITTEEEKERSKLVDVKLMISTDGGSTWTVATAGNFPAEGIDVVLPYPDGTNGDEYSFSVVHMIGTSANGKTAGEIEKPGTTNTSSGIRTHFNGLSPVMITWTKNSSPSKDDGKSEEKAHTHHYVWETVEATENSDGELRYKCDICGDIQTRVPITAYYVFNKNTSEKIRKAGQGATVKIETSRWISFHKMVMQALADRPDVSLEVSFLDGEYKGNRVSFIVPAGTDTVSLLDDNGFAGFLYLAGKLGMTN